MNYCIKHSIFCELSNAYGYCQVTACSKYLQENQIIYSEQINFPQTIGDITFYSSKELIKFNEVWRGKVDDLDWDNLPCGDKYIGHITVVEDEDWLQIWV